MKGDRSGLEEAEEEGDLCSPEAEVGRWLAQLVGDAVLELPVGGVGVDVESQSVREVDLHHHLLLPVGRVLLVGTERSLSPSRHKNVCVRHG